MKVNRILLLSLTGLMCLENFASAENLTSGKCGDNCTWELVGTTLKFSGTGVMDNYDRAGDTTTAEWAPYYNTVTKVEIGSNLTSVGDKAFRGFSSLTSVDFGDNSQLKTIGDRAFSTTGLTSVTIPSSVTEIKEGALGWNSNLSQVNFEDNSQLKSVGYASFYDNKSLTNLDFSKTSKLETISDWAFGGNTSLTSVDFGNNSQLKTIGESAFYDTTSLESLNFGTNSQLETIGNWAFGCSNDNKNHLTSIEMPESLTTIGDYAFRHSDLTSVNFEDDSQLKTIGQGAFLGSTSLISIDFGDNSQLESIGNWAFSENVSLESVDFGENSQLKTIGDDAFWANVKLGTTSDPNTKGSFTIPASVEEIGYHAFDGVNFDILIFEEGSQLQSIGAVAFIGKIGTIIGLDQVLPLLSSTGTAANVSTNSTTDGNFYPDESRPVKADGTHIYQEHTVSNEGSKALCKDVAACEAYMNTWSAVMGGNRTYTEYTYDPDKGYIVGGEYFKTVADLLSGKSYVPKMPKRIYTVDEAHEALGSSGKNTFSVKYR